MQLFALLVITAVVGLLFWAIARGAKKSTPAPSPGVRFGQRPEGDFATTYPLDDGPDREQTKDTGGGPLPTTPK